MNQAYFNDAESSIYCTISEVCSAELITDVFFLKYTFNIIDIHWSGSIENDGWKSFETLRSSDSAQLTSKCRKRMSNHMEVVT